MKVPATILSFLLCFTCFSIADDDRELIQQILKAAKDSDTLTFRSNKKNLTFIDAQTSDAPPISEPFILKVDKSLIWLTPSREKVDITVLNATKKYRIYASNLAKNDIRSEIQIVLSKNSNVALLRKVLEELPMQGNTTVRIWYNEPIPTKKDPELLRKPIAPKQQK